MNLKEMKEMLQLMAEHGLTEIEIEKDGLKVKFKKGGSGGGQLLREEMGPGKPVLLPFTRMGRTIGGWNIACHG